MKNPKISVIIPVYQAEKYLKECVESVLFQSLEGIEIILVDDGSTDASGDLCDCFEKKYESIKVIHKENGGLTAAWKTGVRASQGEFVGFVDSDDWIERDMYRIMLDKAVETEADIVCCGIRHVFEDQNHEPWNDEMLFPEEVYTQGQMRKELYPVLINNGCFMGRTLQPNRVSKLVRRELVIQNMELCNDRVTVGEDYQFSLSIFLAAEKAAVLKGYFPYYYRVNRESMTGSCDNRYLDKIKLMKQQLNRIAGERGGYDFSGQIESDFLCLSVLHLKGAIVEERRSGYFECRRRIKEICGDEEVRTALQHDRMSGLTPAERLFFVFMKYRCYLLIYISVVIYFCIGRK